MDTIKRCQERTAQARASLHDCLLGAALLRQRWTELTDEERTEHDSWLILAKAARRQLFEAHMDLLSAICRMGREATT